MRERESKRKEEEESERKISPLAGFLASVLKLLADDIRELKYL